MLMCERIWVAIAKDRVAARSRSWVGGKRAGGCALKNVAASGLKALVLQAQTLTLKKTIDAWSEVPPAPGHRGALNSRGRIHMLLYCVG